MYDVLQEKRDIILKAASEHGIQNVKIIGSVVMNGERPTSKYVSLLVYFEEGRSLFDLIRFKREVEVLILIKVNVITEESIHWSIKDELLNGAIQL